MKIPWLYRSDEFLRKICRILKSLTNSDIVQGNTLNTELTLKLKFNSFTLLFTVGELGIDPETSQSAIGDRWEKMDVDEHIFTMKIFIHLISRRSLKIF